MDLLPRAALQVEAGAAGHIVLAGVAVILDAAGRIQHKHIGEGHLLAVVGIGHRGAIAVQLFIQAGAGVVVQLLAVQRREGYGQVHTVAVLRGDLGPETEAEDRRVAALRRGAVARQSGADQLSGGVEAVFFAVARVLTALIKGEGRLADVIAVQILIRKGVQQVGSIDVLVDVDRHGVERQCHLQKQIPAGADRPCLADAVRIRVECHQPCGIALGHTLDQHIGGSHTPLGLGTVQRAQRHSDRAFAGIVPVLQTGQRVACRGRNGGRLCRSCGGRRGRLLRRGRCLLPAAAPQQQCRQQRRSAAQCLPFSHSVPLS